MYGFLDVQIHEKTKTDSLPKIKFSKTILDSTVKGIEKIHDRMQVRKKKYKFTKFATLRGFLPLIRKLNNFALFSLMTIN